MATILNLGCGTRPSPYCVNVDFSIHARLRASRIGSNMAWVLLRGQRLETFRQLEGKIVVHDLRRGIPAEDGSVDAVYHSHTLEHLDRSAVPGFFAEVRRVLRADGIHRIAVPDLGHLVQRYSAHLALSLIEPDEHKNHDQFVADIIEQMVRREASGTASQPPMRRKIENLLLGDARRRGETHQWMYDQVNLTHALKLAGFRDATVLDHQKSSIENWDKVALDTHEGQEYKPGSLYIEARK